MERVTGIGGLFFRARDPDMLADWYAEHLGVDRFTQAIWHQEAGPTILAPFPEDTPKFTTGWMLNFRVRDLDAMVAQLESGGVAVEKTQDEAGVGRFAWVLDPEGNRIELWEPDPALGS